MNTIKYTCGLTQWRVNTPSLLKEALECNPGMATLKVPFNILKQVLQELAETAIRIDDPELNAIMCRLALYSVSDPYDPDYDERIYNQVIKEAIAAKKKRLKKK